MFARKFMAVTALALALGSAACGSDGPDDSNGSCGTFISPNGTTSPSAGKLMFTGTFPANETVDLTFANANGQEQTVRGTRENGTSMTIPNLPSGTRNFKIVVTCPGGREEFSLQLAVN